ncbi:hypothetical protein Pmar_PMAR003783 [Perkinsus marinus ATCC 50983]|uniref:Uncharacterized protein n=1 Tax=Perkinsus marinus (strain ATCC 50983 / TXsc) TaxID=423536 RepID=C5LV50_PERM5|nr:hypothetical protein Pmar_PMAR003783 [Perkinsus marinus ATCC 50983]EEQ99389.1 hypothetical protein Pmar_PMAR003783 [Perkinsus marinus ATCC 50983]|eukprot:XP_002766672.1 hypothetical protein Pmar_PMAR003783 [Perkinsus marinus ATCC 50983]
MSNQSSILQFFGPQKRLRAEMEDESCPPSSDEGGDESGDERAQAEGADLPDDIDQELSPLDDEGFSSESDTSPLEYNRLRKFARPIRPCSLLISRGLRIKTRWFLRRP